MNKPYVGVTGAATEEQAKGCVSILTKYFSPDDAHMPMLGILVSYKTLEQGRHLSKKEFPPLDMVSSLLGTAEGRLWTTIHYNTKKRHFMADEVSSVFDMDDIYESNLCRAVQLNVIWPYQEGINKIKDRYPEMKIILSLSGAATKGMTIDQIVENTASYSGIDYVLIDPSMGFGKDFEIDCSLKLYNALKNSGVTACIGFAGGLSGENAREKVLQIRKRLNSDDFCIDAQGRLRDENDEFDLEKVRHYAEEAWHALTDS